MLKKPYIKTLAQKIEERYAGKEALVLNRYISYGLTPPNANRKVKIIGVCNSKNGGCGCNKVLFSWERPYTYTDGQIYSLIERAHIEPEFIILEKPEDFSLNCNLLNELIKQVSITNKRQMPKLLIQCDQLIAKIEDYLPREDIVIILDKINVALKEQTQLSLL